MTETFNPDLDLKISRIIRAPRRLVWNAWTDKASLEKWWVPHPGQCRVDRMELHPGGAFETRYSEDGKEFGQHVSGCFLAVDHEERLIFTDALTAGFRPSAQPFLTAVMTFRNTLMAWNMSLMPCTTTLPTATGMRRWVSSTAGIRLRSSWRNLSRSRRRIEAVILIPRFIFRSFSVAHQARILR